MQEKNVLTENPLDSYIENIFHSFYEKEGSEIIFAHKEIKDNEHFPFQHFADSIGQSKLRETNMLFHQQYGYWFSLRAILLFSANEEIILKPSLEAVCDYDCDQHCKPRFNKYKQTEAAEDHILFRKSCPYGKDYQFSDDQIRYHYFQDRKILLKKNGEIK